MQIVLDTQVIWRLIARFAYRRWCRMGDQHPTGIPGNRDPASPCTAYAPRSKISGDFEDCLGDGHYLCRECCHLDATAQKESSSDAL